MNGEAAEKILTAIICLLCSRNLTLCMCTCTTQTHTHTTKSAFMRKIYIIIYVIRCRWLCDREHEKYKNESSKITIQIHGAHKVFLMKISNTKCMFISLNCVAIWNIHYTLPSADIKLNSNIYIFKMIIGSATICCRAILWDCKRAPHHFQITLYRCVRISFQKH